MDIEKDINWVDAFKDEAFKAKLRETFEQFFNEHTMSDEDFDDVLDEIFKYDELKESLTFNKAAFKNNGYRVPAKSSEKNTTPAECDESNTPPTDINNSDNQYLTDEDIQSATKNLRMLLLLLLMKDNGLELDKNNMSGDKSKSEQHKNHGNGKRAAELMSLITGIPLQSCKNFITNQTISTKNIKDLVTRINVLLMDMGMRIRID